MTQPPPHWFRDNLEAVVIAIVMALVLRHFCIEAFKIPTPSMEPTLIGREDNGDRILVDKLAYLFSSPRRWDVIVFKYPLDITKNYIKRLVGLPGETIELRDGDLFVDGAIARKPRAVQDVLWRNWPWYEWTEEGASFEREWTPVADAAARVALEDGWLVISAPDRGEMELGKRIMDTYRDSNSHHPHPVGDVRIAGTVAPTSGTEEIVLSIREHSAVASLHLAVEGSPTTTRLFHEDHEIWRDPGLKLAIGSPTAISFCNVDDAFVIDIDGEEVLRHEYEGPCQREPRLYLGGTNHVRLGVVRGEARFRDISVQRDIHYAFEARDTWNRTPGSEVSPSWGVFPSWTIPEDRFFVLGDNGPHSKDSRYWGKRERVLLDGRKVMGDSDPRSDDPALEGDPNSFLDRYGEAYSLAEIDPTVVQRPPQPLPFIDRRLLLGKAFCVFWPPFRSHTDLLRYRQTGRPDDASLLLNTRFVR
jgi:signal peptidase I